MAKQRFVYIDRLKGLAMLMVVVGHIFVFCGLEYDNMFINHIVAINMPLFLFLNGLVTNGIKFHYIESDRKCIGSYCIGNSRSDTFMLYLHCHRKRFWENQQYCATPFRKN